MPIILSQYLSHLRSRRKVKAEYRPNRVSPLRCSFLCCCFVGEFRMTSIGTSKPLLGMVGRCLPDVAVTSGRYRVYTTVQLLFASHERAIGAHHSAVTLSRAFGLSGRSKMNQMITSTIAPGVMAHLHARRFCATSDSGCAAVFLHVSRSMTLGGGRIKVTDSRAKHRKLEGATKRSGEASSGQSEGHVNTLSFTERTVSM